MAAMKKSLTDRTIELFLARPDVPLTVTTLALELGTTERSLKIPLNTLLRQERIVREPDSQTYQLNPEQPTVLDVVRSWLDQNSNRFAYADFTIRAGMLTYDIKYRDDEIDGAMQQIASEGQLVLVSDDDDYSRHDGLGSYLTLEAAALRDKERARQAEIEAAKQQEADLDQRRSQLADQMLALLWPMGVQIRHLQKAAHVRADLVKLLNKHDVG